MPKKLKSESKTCLLCKLLTENGDLKVIYRNSLCLIVPCSYCDSHILILKRHGKPTEAEKRQLDNVAGELYPNSRLSRASHFDSEHYHWHIYE